MYAEVLGESYSSEELDVKEEEDSAEELVFCPLELDVLSGESTELLEKSSYSEE
jgi:hypothetical protein